MVAHHLPSTGKVPTIGSHNCGLGHGCRLGGLENPSVPSPLPSLLSSSIPHCRRQSNVIVNVCIGISLQCLCTLPFQKQWPSSNPCYPTPTTSPHSQLLLPSASHCTTTSCHIPLVLWLVVVLPLVAPLPPVCRRLCPSTSCVCWCLCLTFSGAAASCCAVLVGCWLLHAAVVPCPCLKAYLQYLVFWDVLSQFTFDANLSYIFNLSRALNIKNCVITL